MKKFYTLLFIVAVLILDSCSFFQEEQPENVIARVNNVFLYKDDVAKVTTAAMSPQDSLAAVQVFINEWATQQLLLEGAKRNLTQDEQHTFDKLVESYKQDLYTKTYKDALIQKQLDSLVTDQEAAAFYEENKENFNLNEDLVQLRYIQIPEDYRNLKKVQQHFIDFKEEDIAVLDSLRLQFNSYFFNDSTWIQRSTVTSRIHPINSKNADDLLKKTNFLQLRDSLGLYLIAVKNTLSRKQTAPLEYVRPTINQIIKNKRKLELIKKLEKDIKEDAIKDKRFEIYN